MIILNRWRVYRRNRPRGPRSRWSAWLLTWAALPAIGVVAIYHSPLHRWPLALIVFVVGVVAGILMP